MIPATSFGQPGQACPRVVPGAVAGAHAVAAKWCIALVAPLILLAGAVARADEDAADPLFDRETIERAPLDPVVLESAAKEGIVTEQIEFTSTIEPDGSALRVRGILAYPERRPGAATLPGVLWCQGGMAAASEHFPLLYAKKGCVCLAITLRHDVRRSFEPFDTSNPTGANLTRLAIDQMRAVTYLAQRPEVDPSRLGVAGSSYGGFFASLVAGADPRIRAGVSYFAGGRHDLGTNLPQFTRMKTGDDVEVWRRTIDPAWRLARRDVPFLWGVAANDNWFFFPAVTETCREARSQGRRLVIVPHWEHGFPPDIDDTLNNFLDTHLGLGRREYLDPGALRLENRDGRIVATWGWKGPRRATRAFAAVSYGPTSPWLGWQHRATLVVPATIEDGIATATIPLPEADLRGVVWGSVVDEENVTVSTLPTELVPASLGRVTLDPRLRVDGFPRGDFAPDDLAFFSAQALPLAGKADRGVRQAGEQSLRIDVDPRTNRTPTVEVRLHHVPLHAHRARVWLRGEKETRLSIHVAGFRPVHWKSPAVRAVVERDATLGPMLATLSEPVASIAPTLVDVGPEWREAVIDVPADLSAIDRYVLVISQPAPGASAWWYDSLSFEVVWRDAQGR